MRNQTSSISAYPFLMLCCLLANFSCVSTFESARMLKRGEVELKGNFTHVSETYEGETDAVSNNFGFGIGAGINDRINFKVRYERLSSEGDGINFFTFGPKIGLKKDLVAMALPVWAYFAEGESSWGVSPALFFNVTKPSNTFESTLGFKADFSFETDSELLLGFNLGFGLSKDLNKWSVRPDLGIVFNPGEKGAVFTLGIGAQTVLAPSTSKK